MALNSAQMDKLKHDYETKLKAKETAIAQLESQVEK
jgi:hypothetical protein